MCVLFPQAYKIQLVLASICPKFISRFLKLSRGEEWEEKLDSPAALHGGTGGLLIQLLLQAALWGLYSQLNTRPPHFLNTQPRQSHTPSTSWTAQKYSTLSRVSRRAPSSSWGATCEKYFSVEIHFTHRGGPKGEEVVKTQLKGQWEGLWDGVTEWRERWREEE